MTQHLPQTVDEGFVKMSWVFTSLSPPPALRPVKEQQSVCELAETITELFVLIK